MINQAMATEDFSFPRISDTCPCSIDSPPLWNLSPAGSPNPYQAFREGNTEDGRSCFEGKLMSQAQRKSFQNTQNGQKRVGVDDEEDKMDLLWENFNEDLATVELRCGPTLAVVKTSNGTLLPAKNNKPKTSNGALLPAKTNKPSMVLVVKVLKKLFSLHNSQGKPRNRVR